MTDRKMARITQAELMDAIDYDPKTGVFAWRKDVSNTVRKGDIAGYVDMNGYRVIGINGLHFKAQRLAWLWVHGYHPENMVDHKDRNKDHNWIDNLREVSNSCNIRNIDNPVDNKSGVKGVGWNRRYNRWRVDIGLNGRQHGVGMYDDFDDAVCARLAAEQCLNWAGCDSSSPAFRYVKEHVNVRIR